ncbi:MAG: hypothetical protein U0892_09560 [Pirellulales bacterium]
MSKHQCRVFIHSPPKHSHRILLRATTCEVLRSYRFRSRSIAFLLPTLLWILIGCTGDKPDPESKSASPTDKPPVVELSVSDKPAESTTEKAPAESSSAASSTTPSPQSGSEKTEANQTAAEPMSTESWTDKRLLIAAPGGPIVLVLKVNAGGKSLSEGFEVAATTIADELKVSFAGERDDAMKWEALLALPLVRTGWLGNLVPEESQRPELLGLYDKNKDGSVQADEFRSFATRGLARQPHLRVGAKKNRQKSSFVSPWGPLDSNNDSTLDKQEISQATATLARYDFDNDSVLSRAEPRSASDTDPQNTGNMMSSMGMVNATGMLTWDTESKASTMRKLIEEYGFGIEIPRDAWWAWSDERWKELDTNDDGKLVRKELELIDNIHPGSVVECRLPVTVPSPRDQELKSLSTAAATSSTDVASAEIKIISNSSYAESKNETSPQVTDPMRTSGSLITRGAIRESTAVIAWSVSDDHNASRMKMLRSQFEAAKDQSNFQQAVATALQLKDEAFKYLGEDGKAGRRGPATKRPAPERWMIRCATFISVRCGALQMILGLQS